MDGHPCPPSRPCGAGLSETHHMSTNGVSLKPRARSRRRWALDAATARISRCHREPRFRLPLAAR